MSLIARKKKLMSAQAGGPLYRYFGILVAAPTSVGAFVEAVFANSGLTIAHPFPSMTGNSAPSPYVAWSSGDGGSWDQTSNPYLAFDGNNGTAHDRSFIGGPLMHRVLGLDIGAANRFTPGLLGLRLNASGSIIINVAASDVSMAEMLSRLTSGPYLFSDSAYTVTAGTTHSIPLTP